MSLKTSLFNRSIYKSDIKRYWWVGVLETILLFIFFTMPIWDRCQRALRNFSEAYVADSILSWMNGQIIVLIIFAVCVATLLLSYMHFNGSVSFFHSIPVKRSTMLTTKVMSGLTITISPVVINLIFIIAIALNPDFKDYFDFSYIINWFLCGVLYTVVVFALTAAVNMMTGNPIGTIIFTVGFAVLPLAILTFAEYFFAIEIYGYYRQPISWLLEYIYISDSRLIGFPYAVIYLGLVAVFMFLAYALYKKRKLETNGEVITFKSLKPLFITIVGMFASMASYGYFQSLTNKAGIWYFIPLGILGTIIAWMISRKSISIKGILKPIFIYVTAFLCVWSVITFDVFGFEKRVPDADEVLSVDFENVGQQQGIHLEDGFVSYTFKGELDTSLTKKEDIQNVINFHKYMLTKKHDKRGGAYIPIRYNLKNGKSFIRLYFPSYTEDAHMLESIYVTPEIKAQMYEMVDGAEKRFKSINIYDRRISGDSINVSPDGEDARQLIEAIQKDIANMPYNEMHIENLTSTYVSFDYECVVETDRDVDMSRFSYIRDRHTMIHIQKSFKETNKVLEKMGILNKIPQAKDLKTAMVKVWKSHSNDRIYYEDVKETMPADASAEGFIKVTDAEEIDALYKEYDNMLTGKKYKDYNNCMNVRIDYETNWGHIFQVSCSYDDDNMPDVFRKYIK